MLTTDIVEVEFTPYGNDNFVGTTSDSTSESVTLFCSWCIPWFLWSTVKCNPSLTDVIFSNLQLATPEVACVFNEVVIPVIGCVNVIVPFKAKSPWTLSSINSSVLPNVTIDNLAFLPTLPVAPIVPIPRTSPTWYPLPEDIILADEIPPSVTNTSAVMKSPVAVTLVRATPTNNCEPDAGVKPKPALTIPILPVPTPAFPT